MKRFLFIFAAVIIPVSALAQRDSTIVLMPYPSTQGHGHPAPMQMPYACVIGCAICVECLNETDMTIIVRKREDESIAIIEYYYAATFVTITDLAPDEYSLEIIIGDKSFRGEFEIE